jgi:RND family efflux transporter MFP subunit
MAAPRSFFLCITSFTAIFAGCERRLAPPAPPPAAVTVAHPVEREVLDWDEYIGHLAPIEMVELRARVGGYLLEANFKEGSIVEKGAILFKIDPAPYKAELARAQGQIEQAKAQAENAVSEYNRIDHLRASGGASEKEYQDAKYNKLQTAAAVVSAQAAALTAELNLEYTDIKAPITGRVSNKWVTPGNIITGGVSSGTLLTTINSVDPIYCYIDADEKSVLKYQRLAQEKKRISARQQQIPCFLQIGGETGFPHEGVVDFVDNRIDPGTATLRARGLFSNSDGWFVPGTFCRVRIPGSGRYHALLIPDAAIDSTQDIKFLHVVKPDNTVEFRPIVPGALFGKFRAVESGLSESDRVVVNGIQRAVPDSKVNPTEITLDVSTLTMTAPGSPSTQAMPATRHLPAASAPSTPASTGGLK